MVARCQCDTFARERSRLLAQNINTQPTTLLNTVLNYYSDGLVVDGS